jgi:hypothetical protein
MEDPFKGESMDVKVTIEVDDYHVIMQGKLEPPVIKTNRWDNDFYHHQKGLASDGITQVHLDLKPDTAMKIQRVKWTIPIAIKPRIEVEDA